MEIKDRWSNRVLYSDDKVKDLKSLVKSAMRAGANLYGANLYGADLSGADLSGADLSGADLYGADLSRANLSGANLSRADLSGANLSGADLYGADLYGADLYGADLSRANLYGANLSRADLSGANLSGANLSRADLSGADLSRADLYGAAGINKYRTTPLMMLLDQVGKIRAYKIVQQRDGVWTGPTYSGLEYVIGETVSVDRDVACTDETVHCGAGVNVATLDWCMREWQPGQKIFVMEFTRDDIAAIPIATDGKFRVFKAKVIKEVDLEKIGLTQPTT